MTPRVQLALAAAALFTARLLFAGNLGLAEDEAYYWVWSQHLAPGYFDHPPAIAWLISAGTSLFGHSEWAVRLACVALGVGTAWLAATASRAPMLVFVVLATAPLLALGGLLATPDVPLVAAWTAGVVAAMQRRWAWVGLACGLAMLSKYTGVLLLPLLIAANPRALRTRGPWVAAVIAGLVYAPNAWWNLTHDAISWRFQLAHVAEAGRPLDVLGAQLLLAGPVLFVLCLVFWWRGWRGDDEARLCFWASFPLVVLAVLSGGEANWAAPAFPAAVIGLVAVSPRMRRWAWVAAGTGGALSAFVLLHANLPLFSHPTDPTLRLRGGPALGAAVTDLAPAAVRTSRYQEAARVHFYSGIPARPFSDAGRASQYDLWPAPPAPEGVFVRNPRTDDPAPLVARDVAWTGPISVDVNPLSRWQLFPYKKR